MVWNQIKDVIPKNFQKKLEEPLNLILKSWKDLAGKTLSEIFTPSNITKKGTLVLKKRGEIENLNLKGELNELKKRVNSFLGKEVIRKIKFF